MKTALAVIIVATALIAGCGALRPVTLAQPVPSPVPATATPTATATPIPSTATNTPIPTPTLALPVGLNTPVPSSRTVITAENLKDLQEVARFYGQVGYVARLTPDKKYLFVAYAGGVDKYSYPSMQKLAHVPIPVVEDNWQDFEHDPDNYLQVTDDGNMILVYSRWLVDLHDNSEPRVRDRYEDSRLKVDGDNLVRLSADGRFVVIVGYNCANGCRWYSSKMLWLRDNSISDVPGIFGFNLTVSPNGRWIAALERLDEMTNKGGTQVFGGTVNIWDAASAEERVTIKLKQPYVVRDIAFSADGRLLAVAQDTSVEIYNAQTGETSARIDGLCKESLRHVMFAPTQPPQLFVKSYCGSIYADPQSIRRRISGGLAWPLEIDGTPDFSKITFDELGNYSSIPFPTALADFKPGSEQQNFRFLRDGVFAFNGNDSSCAVELETGSLHCMSSTQTNENGRYLRSGRVLGTDGQFYDYQTRYDRVEVRAESEPNAVYYSIPWQGYVFEVEAIDPANQLIFYRIGLDMDHGRTVVEDMEHHRTVAKWEGEASFRSYVFSKDGRYAAMCKQGNTNYPLTGELLVFDRVQKTLIFNSPFTCPYYGGLAFSNDGSQLAGESYYRYDGRRIYSRVMIMDLDGSFARKQFEMEPPVWAGIVAFTPQNDMLAVRCGEDGICFLDPADGREIHRLNGITGLTNIAFSDDGTLMATSTNWGLVSIWAVPPFTYDR